MELSEHKVKRLLDAEVANKLKEDSFEQIMKLALSHVAGKPSAEALPEVYGSKPDIVKTAHADLTKLLVEAARCDTSPEDLSSLLQCTALHKSLVDKFCEFYASHKEEVQECLETVGNALPHIVDVDWRLDYCIKSNVNNAAGIPMYHVQLSTMKNGDIQNVKFTCSLIQLQEMVYKLKDAARHLEKLTVQ